MRTEYAIFVQARLGSTRFPRKVLQQLAGKRVLDHVLDACSSTGLKTFLLVPEKDEIFFRDNFKVEVFGGSEDDVLSRFFSCAVKNGVENIVRITSDCPFLPGNHIAEMVREHRSSGGFVTNVSYSPDTYESKTSIPDGFDVEVFDFKALKSAHENADDKKDREHVTPWMRRNCLVYVPELCLSINGKFSIDTIDDLARLEPAFHILRSAKTKKVR